MQSQVRTTIGWLVCELNSLNQLDKIRANFTIFDKILDEIRYFRLTSRRTSTANCHLVRLCQKSAFSLYVTLTFDL